MCVLYGVLWLFFLGFVFWVFVVAAVVFNLRSCREEGKSRKQSSDGVQGFLQSIAVPPAALSAFVVDL